jgi:hypothetical protein
VSQDDARAPYPRAGDPNVRTLQIQLTPDEWRQLRLLAAHELKSVQEVVSDILRDELESKPRVGF